MESGDRRVICPGQAVIVVYHLLLLMVHRWLINWVIKQLINKRTDECAIKVIYLVIHEGVYRNII